MSNTKEIHSKPRLHVSLSTCYLEYAPPPPQVFVRMDGRSLVRPYADVITKFSRLDELPFSFTYGALLARFARRSSAIMINPLPLRQMAVFPKSASEYTLPVHNIPFDSQ